MIPEEPWRTVLVKSPIRFALLAPGLPSPKVLITSGEDISDLVGYYSIREAGLEGVLPDETDIQVFTPFNLFIERPSRKGPPYIAVDCWTAAHTGEREELYSLVIDSSDLPLVSKDIIGRFEAEISTQLQRAINAIKKNDQNELRYVANIFSTFIVMLVQRMQYENDRIEKRSKFYRDFMRLYLFILVAFITIAALFFISQDLASIFSDATKPPEVETERQP